MKQITVKPAVYVGDCYYAPHENPCGHLAGWKSAADEGAMVVCSTGTRTFDDAYLEAGLSDKSSDKCKIWRVADEDVLTEAEVMELLNTRVANRQGAKFAKEAGVATTLIHSVLRGDRRPGGKILDALYLLRMPTSQRLYIRWSESSGFDPWESDLRGGAGGTELFYT